MKPSQILDDAADVIERNGHHRGAFYDHGQAVALRVPAAECRVCLIGAINVAAGREPAYMVDVEDPVVVAVAAQISEYIAPGDDLSEAIADWNDRLVADGGAVATVLRAAAGAEREAGR